MGKSQVAVLAREYGRRALLKHIRRAGRIPRIELADQTGISRATVTTITAELLQNGLIEEIDRPDGESDMRRGRPRVDLKIRGAARLVTALYGLPRPEEVRTTLSVGTIRGGQSVNSGTPSGGPCSRSTSRAWRRTCR